MSDDDKPKVHYGTVFNGETGEPTEPAAFHHGEGEECPGHEVVIDQSVDTWRDSYGRLNIRRNSAHGAFVGASKQYSDNYDDMDWGN